MYNKLGNTLRNEGKLTEAIAVYNQAIERDPQNIDAHRRLCAALQVQGPMAETLDAARKLVELNPGNADAYNVLAWLLVTVPIENGEYQDIDSAVSLAQNACKLAPNNAGFWNTLGVAHYRAEQWQEVIAAMEESMELGVDHPTNWLFLAMAHQRQGNRDEAQHWYRKSIAWRGRKKLDAKLQSFYTEAATVVEP
ncbi:tetratricopeptide repeat protein [Novipirellula artificiosorum]|uniref:tetratricopeptide repeat protein n=1 Tax=Novipirellula artificiosorum TaxID=2528016 RepID=UPI001E3AD251|nr:tetratricopeptide repeat protein [Novipirellula artificiosorum]